jgi:hypothetical protein
LICLWTYVILRGTINSGEGRITAKELKRKLIAAGWVIKEGGRHQMATHSDRPEALLMAKDAVEMWLWDAENNHEAIPVATDSLNVEASEIFTLIAADTDEGPQAALRRPPLSIFRASARF